MLTAQPPPTTCCPQPCSALNTPSGLISTQTPDNLVLPSPDWQNPSEQTEPKQTRTTSSPLRKAQDEDSRWPGVPSLGNTPALNSLGSWCFIPGRRAQEKGSSHSHAGEQCLPRLRLAKAIVPSTSQDPTTSPCLTSAGFLFESWLLAWNYRDVSAHQVLGLKPAPSHLGLREQTRKKKQG